MLKPTRVTLREGATFTLRTMTLFGGSLALHLASELCHSRCAGEAETSAASEEGEAAVAALMEEAP